MNEEALEEQIRDILLAHKGWENAIKSKDIAQQIGIEPGASNVKIRTLITKTFKKFRLPIGSAGTKGYFLIETESELINCLKTLESRISQIEDRKYRTQFYFELFYDVESKEDEEGLKRLEEFFEEE